MKTAQTAPTAPEAGLLTGASPSLEPTVRRHGVEPRTIVIRSTGNWASPGPHRTGGLGLQPGVYSIGATVRARHGTSVMDWFYGRTPLYVEPGKVVRGYFSHAALVAAQI